MARQTKWKWWAAASIVLAANLLLSGCCNPVRRGVVLRGDFSVELNRTPWDGCDEGACYSEGVEYMETGTPVEAAPTPATQAAAAPFPRFHPVPSRPVFSHQPRGLLAYFPVFGRSDANYGASYYQPLQGRACATGQCPGTSPVRTARRPTPVSEPPKSLESKAAPTPKVAVAPEPVVSESANPVKPVSAEIVSSQSASSGFTEWTPAD